MTNDQLKIRQFKPEDKAEVIDLWNTVFKNDPPWNDPASIIRRKLAFQPELFLVGVKNGHIVTTVLGGYDGFRGWIYHLAVKPDQRRKGIGKRMMTAIEQLLLDLECVKINLQVRSSNPDVTAFYHSIGYSIEDHTSMGKVL